ncbi:hypothetical protein [Deinococcus sp. RIT780]|uniref:hypothetical protein n=1 Tax=Deinococcus sp. RIT780 TaxID=2870472 RepID=UPI001C88EE96|nr:hypothetical protein [Deinococcus sp. RIT780]MBX8465736.1 hypothetical protein [Deinococcus sp. RIT780]
MIPPARRRCVPLSVPLVALAFVACRPASDPPASAAQAASVPASLVPASLTLRADGAAVQLRASGPAGARWQVVCDTFAGPLVWEGTLPPASGPEAAAVTRWPRPDARRCEATLRAPPGAGDPTTLARAALTLPASRPATTTATTPANTPAPAAAPAPLTGRLSVTPATVRLGLREPWAVQVTLRRADGTPAPDGTPVLLSADGPGGARLSATRVTVNGEASWQLTPDVPGPYRLQARAGRWQAAADASVRPALLGRRPPVLWAGPDLQVGPLRWTTGAYPDDGTPVTLQALNRSGRVLWTAQVTTAQGVARARVPTLTGAVTLRLSVAGAEERLPWP